MYNVILKAKPGFKKIFVPKTKTVVMGMHYKRFFVLFSPGKNMSSHICENLFIYLFVLCSENITQNFLFL